MRVYILYASDSVGGMAMLQQSQTLIVKHMHETAEKRSRIMPNELLLPDGDPQIDTYFANDRRKAGCSAVAV